jgi:hypothetical protein
VETTPQIEDVVPMFPNEDADAPTGTGLLVEMLLETTSASGVRSLLSCLVLLQPACRSWLNTIAMFFFLLHTLMFF